MRHYRVSFKPEFNPDEITPQDAFEVGYTLAEKFTHVKHQFVIAVHKDKQYLREFLQIIPYNALC
ncbi:MAG: relaxase/mobilization nuclease domain-containing protein [Clostridiales bacterium]|nr:relaxase/mobilization nuclease domain-containing protein [Clostridiales bacterium]